MSNNASFHVFWSAQVRNVLKQMSHKASLALRKRLAEILRELETRLAHDPLSVGEVYRKRGGIAEFLAVHGFLSIDFAVDETHNLVLVRKCRALSGHGLD